MHGKSSIYKTMNKKRKRNEAKQPHFNTELLAPLDFLPTTSGPVSWERPGLS